MVLCVFITRVFVFSRGVTLVTNRDNEWFWKKSREKNVMVRDSFFVTHRDVKKQDSRQKCHDF